MSKSDEIIELLRQKGNVASKLGMARYGINTDKAFGVSIPFLRSIAADNKNNHELALDLWKTSYHEAMILASMIDDPEKVTEKQIESWVKMFDSWDLCDQCCSNLFVRTPFAYDKAIDWTLRDETFVKRAGFVMMACIAVKRKELRNESFMPFFKLIKIHSKDDRNMVKKAVNWALRQIGKRNLYLNEKAVEISEDLLRSGNKTALWIARDAHKELISNNVRRRLTKLF
jgi:3-methyladenine DNA glycosylase AlkD